MSTAEIGLAVNKTPQAVWKDFKKEDLHMSVLEAFGKAMNINIYEALAAEWAGKPYPENPDPRESDQAGEEDRPQLEKSAKNIDTVSVTFHLPASKKEALIKLLTD